MITQPVACVPPLIDDTDESGCGGSFGFRCNLQRECGTEASSDVACIV